MKVDRVGAVVMRAIVFCEQIQSSAENHRFCRGFTVLELMVAIGVIGLLAAILLPAVQAARESSRRLTCLNHLHQWSLASMNYESRHGVFPFNGNASWLSNIDADTEHHGSQKTVPLLGCPSDPLATGERSNPSYLANDGCGFNHEFGSFVPSHNGMSAVYFVRARDVTDGLSNTAAISERLTYLDPFSLAGRPEDHRDTWPRRMLLTPSRNTSLDAFADECQFNPLPPYRNANIFKSSGYTHVLPPNSNSCLDGPDPLSYVNEGFFAVTANSFHPGGVNVSFADGSARFISESVDRKVWQALGTRNGHENTQSAEF